MVCIGIVSLNHWIRRRSHRVFLYSALFYGIHVYDHDHHQSKGRPFREAESEWVSGRMSSRPASMV